VRSSAHATPDVTALSVAILVESELLRHGLESILQSLPSVGGVSRCATRHDVTELLRSQRLDFLIVSAPVAEDLGIVQPCEGRRPRVLVLMDGTAAIDPSGYAAMPADGFLYQQDLSAQTLHDALRRSAAGELPMPATLARALLARADGAAGQHRNRPVNLTSREVQALSLLVRGLSNKQIARQLGISSHGAKRLVASIMLKLDSPNRTTAVVNAIKAGLVDDI
jgi:two-component system, NarL family, nitrate/nitrite response regulator NarL